MSEGAGKAFLKYLCEIMTCNCLQRSPALLPAYAFQIAGPAFILSAKVPVEMYTPVCAVPLVVMLALFAAASRVVCACCVAKYASCRLNS